MRTILRALALSVCGLALAGSAYASDDAPCCGPITDAARALERKLDATGVDHLWLPGHHVDWRTGEPDSDAVDNGHGNATHCSAFAASVAESFGAYLLRPPQHSQILLANAQTSWLDGPDAVKQGWRKVGSMREAQALANEGRLVVASFRSPNPKKPGHIAILRPSTKSAADLERDGPQITQAGFTNALSTTVRKGFGKHHGAWPDGIGYYAFTPGGGS